MHRRGDGTDGSMKRSQTEPYRDDHNDEGLSMRPPIRSLPLEPFDTYREQCVSFLCSVHTPIVTHRKRWATSGTVHLLGQCRKVNCYLCPRSIVLPMWPVHTPGVTHRKRWATVTSTLRINPILSRILLLVHQQYTGNNRFPQQQIYFPIRQRISRDDFGSEDHRAGFKQGRGSGGMSKSRL